MNQITINGIPGWIGHESGGWNNGPNGYKIVFSVDCPSDETLRQSSTTWHGETAVIRVWEPLSTGFMDTPGRRQIVFNAAVSSGIKSSVVSEELIKVDVSRIWDMSEKDTKAFRRRIEDHIRKNPSALFEMAEKLDWVRNLI